MSELATHNLEDLGITGDHLQLGEWKIVVQHADVQQGLEYAGDPGDLLVPVPGYASDPFPRAFHNLGVIAGRIPYDESGGEDPENRRDVTAYHALRKDLTPEGDLSLREGDEKAEEAIRGLLGGDLYSYVKGEVVPANERRKPSLDLPVSFEPNSMSGCVSRTRERGRAGAGLAAHREVAGMIDLWFEHSAIDKMKLRRERDGKRTDVLVFTRYLPIRVLPKGKLYSVVRN